MDLPFRDIVDRLKESFWFLPTVMAIGGVLLAAGALWLDAAEVKALDDALARLMAGGSDASVSMLAALAGSIITVTGVVFSVTILTLSLASNQFGPRLLHTFRSDRGNQLVLGTFIATYTYCLVALLNVGSDDDVMRVTVFGAFLLTAASIGVFIYFIHHVAVSIQADTVIARVADELFARIDLVFPHPQGAPGPVFDRPGPPVLVRAMHNGYVETIGDEALVKKTCAADAVVDVRVMPGEYVSAGAVVAHVWGPLPSEEVAASIELGARRTGEQDVAAGIQLLVEVAVRAISTGINDPFTAGTCVDRLGSVLSVLATRDVGDCLLHRDGRQRVLLRRPDFGMLLASACDEVVHHARNEPLVLERMLVMLNAVGLRAGDPKRRRAVLRQVGLLRQAMEGLVPFETERLQRLIKDVEAQQKKLLEAVGRADPA